MSPRKLWPMMTTPLISPWGKLRMLAEPFVPPRQRLEPNRLAGEFDHGGDDENVASFVTRRLGREAFERLVQPLVAGIYTADSTKLSMAATMPEFLRHERRHGSLLWATLRQALKTTSAMEGAIAAEDTQQAAPAGQSAESGARYGLFVSPRAGLGALVKRIEQRIPATAIHLNTRVAEITRRADRGWQLSFAGGAEPTACDGVIVAVPAFAAADLLVGCHPRLADQLRSILYAGCAVVSLGFDLWQLAREVDSFGFVVPRVEGRRILAASFASRKFPGRAPCGSILIRVFVGGALQPDLIDLPDQELLELALGELRELLGIAGAPTVVDIARWPRSMPQYHLGHLSRVARIERYVADLRGLALAGNAYHGVGIPQCVRSGELAAERVAAVCGVLTAG